MPGFAVQVPPQVGVDGLKLLAKPLKLAGAEPPERLFKAPHWALQNVTTVEGVAVAAVASPSAKLPPGRNANTIAVWLLSEEGR